MLMTTALIVFQKKSMADVFISHKTDIHNHGYLLSGWGNAGVELYAEFQIYHLILTKKYKLI